MEKYALGLDFGTLSVRALLVEIFTGREVAVSAFDYPHSVMDKALPNGKELPDDWALQHPEDYLEGLVYVVRDILKTSGVSADKIVGIGVDFTACTMLATNSAGVPLCLLSEYQAEPHAYAKLWKHHAAQKEATLINAVAEKRSEAFLARYGGKVSSEWLIPKIWQVLNEAPEIYEAAKYFIEAGDWLVWQLTGRQTRNACAAGYKGMWHKKSGYPSKEFFRELDPRLENIVSEKLNCPVYPLGSKAGEVTQKICELTGLSPHTAVAVANVDAHVTVPACKITAPGQMLAIIGTSTCHMMADVKELNVGGISGVVEDGILPGYFGYEAGQACVGDHFAWFVNNCCPGEYSLLAKERGISLHQLLSEKAALLYPGESGLVALDWYNGNRSVLVDAELSGMLLGMTLATKPEELYRALLEATAYGTRKILDTFRDSGIPVNELTASGGIPQKNAFAMQVYADVLKIPIRIGGSAQAAALGSAIFGAVAAGKEGGGHAGIFEAAQAMGKLDAKVYLPDEKRSLVYDALYAEYEMLHDYFGRGENDVMKRLKAIRRTAR